MTRKSNLTNWQVSKLVEQVSELANQIHQAKEIVLSQIIDGQDEDIDLKSPFYPDYQELVKALNLSFDLAEVLIDFQAKKEILDPANDPDFFLKLIQKELTRLGICPKTYGNAGFKVAWYLPQTISSFSGERFVTLFNSQFLIVMSNSTVLSKLEQLRRQDLEIENEMCHGIWKALSEALNKE